MLYGPLEGPGFGIVCTSPVHKMSSPAGYCLAPQICSFVGFPVNASLGTRLFPVANG